MGLGSRGLSVLERIVTLAKKAGPDAVTVRIEVIDPTCSGAGVHAIDQPDYLLLNTTAAAVSMFPDAATVGSDVDEPGPSLFDWVTERGLRVAEDGFTVGTEGRLIRPTDFLPRRVLGEYLGYFLEEVLRRAPEHVAVRLHRAEAVDLTSEPDGSLTVTLAGGGVVRTDYAFLTTGYTANEPATANPAAANSRFVSEPYELLARSAELAPGQVVAIGGFGLSAMDLMSSLTVGRGGRFIGAGNQHRYQPSGQEPTLLMYSRSGVPCRARPLVTKWDFKYEPRALTRAAIDELRADR
ncbi:MAG TPA: FAD/NAD(P)-binding protein, partial [Micromonosporaceae bacterium]